MFSIVTADDFTTTSAPSIFASLCPMKISTPADCKRLALAFKVRSEPDISYPWLCSTSAIPHIPLPPIPTKCIRRILRISGTWKSALLTTSQLLTYLCNFFSCIIFSQGSGAHCHGQSSLRISCYVNNRCC